VEIGGQLLREDPPWPIRTLQDFFQAGEAEVRLCRLMYDQVPPVVACWLQMHEVPVIHLIRQDHIHREVLNWMDRHREQAGSAPVEVDVSWVLKRAQIGKNLIAAYRRLFETGPYLEIAFEDMVGQGGEGRFELPKDLDAKLLRFLELTPHPLTATLRQPYPDQVRPLVSNYDQLMQAAANTSLGRAR
jgi:hypothetical protein